jgi:hypothetical protein
MNSNPANIVVLTAVVVTAGRWAKKEPVDIRIVIGGTVFLLFIAGLSEASPKLAQQFALLVLLAALFNYGIPIFENLNFKKETQ